jgi:hypothetical protein
MDTITVKINPRTLRGKHLIGLLHDMAKDGNDIIFEEIPNSETNHSIEDARKGKGFRVTDATGTHSDLFK